jgi:hypothetical protein
MHAFTHEDIPGIIANRKRFDETLYTPLEEAYEELERRRRDPRLEHLVLEALGGNVLEPLQQYPKAVVARSVVSPNYEITRFADVAYGYKKLEPLFLEYHSDKFASNNESKRMMGRLYFYNGKGRSGTMRTDSLNIIDFSSSNGEGISAVKTLWGQDFVGFHHEFFDSQYQKLSHMFFDASHWLRAHGKSATHYYRAFLSLFIRHGILFENVMLNDEEVAFTSKVFLPAFISVHKLFGLKPLIVPLAPTDTEESPFWMCYPSPYKSFVAERLYRHQENAAFL